LLSRMPIQRAHRGRRALGKIGPEAKASIPQLALALKDAIPKVRSNAAQSLGQMGAEAKSAIPALIAAFSDRTKKRRARPWKP